MRGSALPRPHRGAAWPCMPPGARTPRAARLAPLHRPALLIQPHSIFCILLVGGLPTDFADRSVGES
ncbi:hypothetical protein C6Q03_24925 [Burkholderia multivorans]|nr:hypothetical protein C6Q03_24925 [Burkholderia multivorans]